MIKAANFSEAHPRRYLLPPYPAVYLDTYITNLIADFRDASVADHLDGGHALFAEYGEGYATTHAHPVDQWQVYVSGCAKLAKKPVPLVTVQYTDAWVPYGPIEVTEAGFALLALWPRPNDATYEMPKDIATVREHLRGKPHRILFEQVDIDESAPAIASETTLIDASEIWARHWRLPAGVTLVTPDPALGGGQFFVPLRGSVDYDGRGYPRWSTIYVGPRDGAITLRAGAEGVDLLGMQFGFQPVFAGATQSAPAAA